MGVALVLIGFLTLVAVAVVAVGRLIRRRPTRPLGRSAVELTAAAVVLMGAGAAITPTPRRDCDGDGVDC